MFRPFALSILLLAPTLRAADPATTFPNIYFGNLHAHTAFSDGSGNPDEAFAHARDVAKVDFLAITEHNHLIGGKDATPEQRTAIYTGPAKDALVPAAANATVPGKFVAIYGQEFSTMSKGNHLNIFDIDNVIQLADVPNGDHAALLKWLDKNRDSTGEIPIVQFNHPVLGGRPPKPGEIAKVGKVTYGRDDFGDDTGWVTQMGAVTHLIEVINGKPLPGIVGRHAEQIMEEHYRLFLRFGFRVAPTGNQDNHEKDWGESTDARTAILATELTKPALLAALRARHCYASEDENLRVIIRVNGQLCGDALPASATAGQKELAITYAITDPDEPTAAYTLDVFRGVVGAADDEGIVRTIAFTGDGGSAERPAILTGVAPPPPGGYVFFRVTQKTPNDPTRDRAWTSAVWVEKSE